ncbi:hypothetical protein SAMN05443668_10552 [Cryptosporangium aurantiacum]|uniref:Uncharacterized protein n=1 Tax=Cryptosporangium aurantiacum TaxID=134849 RepID=A0A1M7QMQ2_9ACTN|nr:hypothetical protein SAMN05443668_10552 [Cryptosporangium aurantiacum]
MRPRVSGREDSQDEFFPPSFGATRMISACAEVLIRCGEFA